MSATLKESSSQPGGPEETRGDVKSHAAGPSGILAQIFQLKYVIILSVLLHLGLFLFGIYQDRHMQVKFTDIDYFVFTDAARFVFQGGSPYQRATYRYTPLLAWLLTPCFYFDWFDFGKLLFCIGDVIAGYLIVKILVRKDLIGLSQHKATLYASIWLLNPMVATISARGSSEGLLGFFVTLFLFLLVEKHIFLAGLMVGFCAHFKIFPVIYIPTAIMAITSSSPVVNLKLPLIRFLTWHRLLFAVSALASFAAWGLLMERIYGWEFVEHTYLYHLSRTDHRHNFSLYNVFLYYSSSESPSGKTLQGAAAILSDPAKWAFIPQLSLAGILLPLKFGKTKPLQTMFVQTFVFVVFNKVCTSQYFVWYMNLLPFFLPRSQLVGNRRITGVVALLLWVFGQALWLKYAYDLEFLGISTFQSLFAASLAFFAVNVWMIGLFVEDLK